MQRTKIEYLTHTWNPIAMKCTPVSAGCANCWHLRMSHRFVGMDHFPDDVAMAYHGGDPVLRTDELSAPFRVKKTARIGVQFMGDLFHERITNEQVAAVFGVMAACPQHTFIVLTKRLDRALEWFEWISSSDGLRNDKDEALECAYYLLRQAEPDGDGPIHCKYGPNPDANWPLENVIMCASIEDQPSADERIPLLLQIPAVKRGVSVEPMLGPVNVEKYLHSCTGCGNLGSIALGFDKPGSGYDLCRACGMQYGSIGIDWIVCGSETGPGKRTFKDEWALDLRDQCRVVGTPFFFKKDSKNDGTLRGVEYHEWPED